MDYSFKNFQKNAIIRFLALDNYTYINERLYKIDVSKDKEYQTTFNSFFRVRRNEEWRKEFYNYFEIIKNRKNITFDEILDSIYKRTGNIEASFCSKLLSTINHNMPIIDQYVLKNLNLKIKGNTKDDKLKSTKEVYKELVKIEKEKLNNKDIKKAIDDFKNYFPEYNLSDIKILDYILWNTRDED